MSLIYSDKWNVPQFLTSGIAQRPVYLQSLRN
jgi:hypothetical protein